MAQVRRGHAVKEIAAAMGRSQVCIKVLLYRARVSLAKRLSEEPETMGIDQRRGQF